MNESLRRLRVPSYLVAILFIVAPIVDVLTNVWPWGFGNEQWRFGLVGVTSNYLISLIFGVLLLAFTAAAAEERTALRVTGILAAVMMLLLVVMCFSFILDTIQVRMAVRDEQMQLFKIGAIKTAAKMGTSLVVLGVVAVGAWRAGKVSAA